MSPKAFFTLTALTAVALVGAVVAVIAKQAATTTEATGGDYMFPGLADRADDITQVTIETPSYRIVLEDRDGAWVSVDRGDYPAKGDAVADIMASLGAMTTVEPKTSNPDWYDEIGVAGPGQNGGMESDRITAVAANGDTLVDAIIGIASRSIGSNPLGGTFVRDADQAQSWLVEGSVTVPDLLVDWFDPILSVPGTEVGNITIAEGGTEMIAAAKTDFATGNYDLTFINPSLGPANATAVDDALRGVSQGIVSTTFDDAMARDQVAYDAPPRTLTFDTRGGLHLIVTVGTMGADTWVQYDATADDGSDGVAQAASIAAKTGNWAFKLPSYRLSSLQRPLTDLFAVPTVAPPPEPVVTDPRFLTQDPLIPTLPGFGTTSTPSVPTIQLPPGLQ